MRRWLSVLVWMLWASSALADHAGEGQRRVMALVQEQLIKPLSHGQSKRKRFSRAAPPPVTHRVRVLDDVAVTDARGLRFVRFAVDTRLSWDEESPWQAGRFIGCVYPAQQKVFVQSGEDYVPASNIHGREQPAHATACRPAPTPEPEPTLAIATD